MYWFSSSGVDCVTLTIFQIFKDPGHPDRRGPEQYHPGFVGFISESNRWIQRGTQANSCATEGECFGNN